MLGDLKAGKAIQQQQRAAAAEFPSRLSGGNCRVVKRAFVAADRAGRAHQWEITEQKNNQLLLCYLKRKELANNGGIQVRMKPTQKEAVCLAVFVSGGKCQPEPNRKEERKKRGKSTQGSAAHSSNI